MERADSVPSPQKIPGRRAPSCLIPSMSNTKHTQKSRKLEIRPLTWGNPSEREDRNALGRKDLTFFWTIYSQKLPQTLTFYTAEHPRATEQHRKNPGRNINQHVDQKTRFWKMDAHKRRVKYRIWMIYDRLSVLLGIFSWMMSQKNKMSLFLNNKSPKFAFLGGKPHFLNETFHENTPET